ncbi:Low molecular weight protein-tyrosine-phosphatase YfkJ [Streptococcus intermedius]|uniref:low molecular weight protein-tyrosine-phosphatase n=1 Tax=Streptococcus intermedius TaxID=1338 RepID=UPI000F65E73F|nr:low molecular weight protein-tyrosine-phosphatase [Streptococcus intermedius]RSJ09380.1 Low molecular weight protein-tyrosine-phosphatase YfkJ [Streptococcus intermedius]RSJ15349.1 Low molecular weight protein-tyrosine-phosphatase YfkJ [Streptococcus intermedius]RSJ29427.1 Low molecular weight protein-tyrosine-phosphatase YfkJ [Streptococcus intermedius]
MKKIVFVCLGNICRSPMAEFVMKNLTDEFYVESRATSDWEHGNPIHSGTQGIFRKYAIPYDKSKTSQQISRQDFVDFDYIVGMDESNFQELMKIAPDEYLEKVFQFAEKSVPDPWYTGDFDETYQLVLAGCQKWIERVKSEH